MKDCPDTHQYDPDPRSSPLTNLCTERGEQGFDIGPAHIGARGIFEDPVEELAVLSGRHHGVSIRHYRGVKRSRSG